MYRSFHSSAFNLVKMAKKGRKGRNGNKLGKRDDRQPWSTIQQENEAWEKCYKSQNLVPGDFELFKKTCQETLPLTFRVTGSRKHAKVIADLFQNKIMPLLENVEHQDETKVYKKPFALPWYPDNLAYQIDLPKQVIKKVPEYSKVQKYLLVENEVGNISRQEAVSMIPPLVLDVEPHHHVLDMCAAPGSKTAQLIESLHTFKDSTDDTQQPTGFVMANDSDYRRSYMLVHQIKRLNSANVVVVNHDAQMFPKMRLEENGPYIKFDRILCDVPCSGDATMRKNIMVWKEWRYGNALGLHPLQLNILKRGLQLLKAGGRLVYSTCSLNPLENEAVVAAALKVFGGKVKLVNSSDRLPGLIRHPGVSTWKVYGKDGEEKPVYNEEDKIAASAYPPTEEEAKDMHLDYCMRVYPQDQNTGGFFITVFEKEADVEADVEKTEQESNKREASEIIQSDSAKKQKTDETKETDVKTIVKQRKEKLPIDANEEPFIFLEKDNEKLQRCWDFYQVSDDFPKDCALVRNATGEPLRSIYYVAPIVKQILKLNEVKLRFIYTGIKLFVSQKSDVCPWRIQSECLNVIRKYIPREREVEINLELLKQLLLEQAPSVNEIRDLNVDPEFFAQIDKIGEGSCFVKIKTDSVHGEELFFPLWKGKNSFNLMVNKHETAELLYRLFGIDKAALDKEKKEKEDAEKKAEENVEEKTEAAPVTAEASAAEATPEPAA
jgi:multisite-specific tRNA:(cytosine-C5)-methyltransferase